MPNQLLIGQLVAFTIAGLLSSAAFSEYRLEPTGWPLYGFAVVIALLGWIGTQVVNELAEINDQLAGRSVELQELLSKTFSAHK